MELTAEERAMLDGVYGPAVQEALAYQIRVGEYYGARRMVRVSQAHITADSEVMGPKGLAYLGALVAKGARCAVPTTTNSRCLDFAQAQALGQNATLVEREREIIHHLREMGVLVTDTCTNYQSIYQPRLGEHIAWGDTGAVIYANSVFGARSNFESGPAALAAAITGRVPEYGMHLDIHRTPTVRVRLNTRLNGLADWGMLGRVVGKQLAHYDAVPVFVDLAELEPTNDALKHLGANLATWSVAMFHVVDVTPEITLNHRELKLNQLPEISIDRAALDEEYAALGGGAKQVSLVVFSAPHLSLLELQELAKLLKGRKVRSGIPLIVTTSAAVYRMAEQAGCVQAIQDAGGQFLIGACFYLLDGLAQLRVRHGWDTLVTNSVKLANNIQVHGFRPVVRPMEECVEAAVRGWVE